MLLVAIEEVSKVCATSGLILAVQELGSLGIKLAGTAEQKDRWLPRLASGEWLAAYALTEPGSGSDSAAMRTEARLDGDTYVLNGSKRFITNAGVAGLYTVFAKTDPSSGHGGIPAFVVEADAPGFGVGRIEPKMGIKGSTTGELFFDDCRIPADNLLGEEGEGFRLAMRILDRSRPGVAAQGLGLAQGATDYALEYAKGRETMGRPIAEHQLIQGKLADMEAQCEAARGVLYKVGMLIDEGVDGARADEVLGHVQAPLHGRGDGRHDGCRADPGRLRVHQRVPRGADDARREDHPDLRGHERDPAPRPGAGDDQGEPRLPARGGRLTYSAGRSIAPQAIEVSSAADFWTLTT